MNHVQITHPLLSEQNVILHSLVYASGAFLVGNPSSAQPVAPQHASSQRNDSVVNVTPPRFIIYNNNGIISL